MTDEFNRYCMKKIRTILARDAKTICGEFIEALGSDAPSDPNSQKKGQNDFGEGEKMSMMTLDLVVRFRYLLMRILSVFDKLLTMIHIQLMMIL